MQVHELKILPTPFRAVGSGKKKAEFRVNDRGFAADDVLVMKEISEPGGEYTGRFITCKITDVTDVTQYVASGAPWVMLSIDGVRVLSG